LTPRLAGAVEDRRKNGCPDSQSDFFERVSLSQFHRALFNFKLRFQG
jgi:hypothetical protein